jgi:hypothetical protein
VVVDERGLIGLNDRDVVPGRHPHDHHHFVEHVVPPRARSAARRAAFLLPTDAPGSPPPATPARNTT